MLLAINPIVIDTSAQEARAVSPVAKKATVSHGAFWSPEDFATAKRMRYDGASAAQIAEALGRTRATVYAQLKKIGVIVEAHRSWSGDERARLVEKIRTLGLKEAARQFNTTVDAARYQMEQAGERIGTLRPPVPKPINAPVPRLIRVRIAKPVPVRNARYWTGDDDARLRAAVDEQVRLGVRERHALNMLFPDRTPEAVRLRIQTLGLREAPARMGKASTDKVAAIEALITSGHSLGTIVRQAKTTHRTVHGIAQRLGLTIAPSVHVPKPKVVRQREPAPPCTRERIHHIKAPSSVAKDRTQKKTARIAKAKPDSDLAKRAHASGVPLAVSAPWSPPVAAPASRLVMPEPIKVSFVAKPEPLKPTYNGFRARPGVRVARTEDTMALIAAHLATKGVTKLAEAPHEAALRRLRGRGYIVVSHDDGVTIDHRHRLTGPGAIVAFAEARGLA
jgi:transposase-like protein